MSILPVRRAALLLSPLLLLALLALLLTPTAAGADAATTIYLPTLSSPLPDFRPLGTVSDVVGPTACDGESCYQLTVSCPEVAFETTATVKIGAPTSAGELGTIVFASGYHGDAYWDEWGGESQRVLDELRAAGYRTAQIAWEAGVFWYNGAPAGYEGHEVLACRPATVTQWIHDTIHDASAEQPFCGYGHSNGAGQIAYPLTQYGLSAIYDAVLLDAGPNWARLDYACLDPAGKPAPELVYNSHERRQTDPAFGFTGSNGPCATQDEAFIDGLQEASLAFGRWHYTLSDTQVGYMRGENDHTYTRRHGDYFAAFLEGYATRPLVREIVPGSGHITFSSATGGDTIRDYLLTYCQAP